MTHELAHQWFGNLVTQAWWTETYLAEGFATWMEAKISDQQRPAEQLGVSLIQTRDFIMAADAHATRAVRADPHSRTDADDVYDVLVYLKGAATLKMVEDWIGPDAFQRGVRQYLHDHAYSNANTADLEQALRQASGIDVTAVMDDMLNRTGFATLQFKLEGTKLLIDQDASTAAGLHVLPVCIRSEGAPKTMCQLITAAHAEIPLAVASAGVSTGPRRAQQSWVDTNPFGSGYYRSILTAAMSDSLTRRAWTDLTEAQRLALAIDLKFEANQLNR